jgi:alanine dehydrogenase
VSRIRYLTRDEVAPLMPDVLAQLDLAERVYRAIASGHVEMPPKMGVHPRDGAFCHAMPAYLRDDDIVSVKWVSGYRSNRELGLPYISGLIILSDADTGRPNAILDAAEITAARTAAASGLCVRYFAPSGWSRAALIGCGEQGRAHVAVLRTLNPNVEISVFDVDRESAARVQDVKVSATAREAAEGAQIIITATPTSDTPRPELEPSWLDEEYLALPVDLDAFYTASAARDADEFIVDELTQYETYRANGRFAGWPAPTGVLGGTLASGTASRRIVCCNIGVGALDGAFANYVVDEATAQGVGQCLPV